MQLIGHAGIGKRRLASYIRSEITSQFPTSESISDKDIAIADTKSKSNANISFRTAETLPLEISGSRESTLSLPRPLDTPSSSKTSLSQSPMEPVTRYDLILFMVNMSNRASWEETKHSLLQLDPGWFLGRCAIVVTRISTVSKYAFDRDDITDFVQEFYDIPIIWTNLDVDSEAALTALQVIRMLEVSAGYRRWNTNSSFVRVSGAHPVSFAAAGGAGSHATTPTPPLRSSISSYVGLTLGSRLTATHLLMKSPEKYSVEVTTLSFENQGDHR